MGRDVREIAEVSAAIAEDVSAVAAVARQVNDGADETQRSAAELAGIADRLRGLVGAFRY
jgi:methyl-accepting chemotaxis protein